MYKFDFMLYVWIAYFNRDVPVKYFIHDPVLVTKKLRPLQVKQSSKKNACYIKS